MAENKALRPDELRLFLQAAYGDPVWLGDIVATTTKNNHDTAVPFSNTGNGLGGKVLLLYATGDCHITTGSTNAVTATTATGVPLAGTTPKILTMLSNSGWLACVGSVTLSVWELR